jgi:hypothetical protein
VVHDMNSKTDYRRLAHHSRGLYFVTPSREQVGLVGLLSTIVWRMVWLATLLDDVGGHSDCQRGR